MSDRLPALTSQLEIHAPPMNECERLICPDIRPYWRLAQIKGTDQIILQSVTGNRCFQFSQPEGYALRYFTGQLTAEEIQNRLHQADQQPIPSNLVVELLQKLIAFGILAAEVEEGERRENENILTTHHPLPTTQPKLKACVHWIAHPDGYWILRNPEDITFLQVGDRDKAIIEQLAYLPTHLIAEEFCTTHAQIKYLLRLLAATGMLEGTQPAKPHRRKFSPLQLLSFRIRLFNPDSFLTQHINKLRFIWTQAIAFLLCAFLLISALIGLTQRLEILFTGQKLFAAYGGTLLVPFVLVTALVVTLHELGHAFTLKHFGGIVPEIGLLFICLIPAAYTNTSDSYCLSRWQRVLVVGAGVLVQLILAAVGLWLWNFSVTGTWLSTASFLLMASALFTVALNLNPLSKFDGYYLTVAMTGINNLRSRSFQFYVNLLTGKPIEERGSDRWILAIYAPFSLTYIWFVFGFLLMRIAEWNLTNIPTTAGIFWFLWAIYFLFPASK